MKLPHSTPRVYSSERGSVAPNTWRAVAGTKNSHMQNSPSHVRSCTTASCRIVCGISRMAAPISVNRFASPILPRRARSNAAMSSGGNSLVVATVHSTHTRNTAAPAWNEYFTESGMPLAVLPCTPSLCNT